MRRGVWEQLKPMMCVGEISVGGYSYAHPDHIREFIKEDPCRKCACPKGLCDAPCTARQYWNEQQERGNLQNELEGRSEGEAASL